jgi:ribonuclease E
MLQFLEDYMKKTLVIAEQDNIAAILENERVMEFIVNRGELLLGDIYTASVENILPGIDAAFVNLGKDKMGFCMQMIYQDKVLYENV